jgi:hypothetical protein
MKKAKKLNIKSLVLKSGAHSSVKEGLCVMEAVAYFAGEKHSDRPECACPVLTKFMINTNDRMNADERALLKPYIKKLIGTRDGKSQKRAELLARAAVAEITPYALRLTKIDCLIAHAEKLEKFKDGTGTFTDMSKACKEAKSDANAYANARRQRRRLRRRRRRRQRRLRQRLRQRRQRLRQRRRRQRRLRQRLRQRRQRRRQRRRRQRRLRQRLRRQRRRQRRLRHC